MKKQELEKKMKRHSFVKSTENFPEMRNLDLFKEATSDEKQGMLGLTGRAWAGSRNLKWIISSLSAFAYADLPTRKSVLPFVFRAQLFLWDFVVAYFSHSVPLPWTFLSAYLKFSMTLFTPGVITCLHPSFLRARSLSYCSVCPESDASNNCSSLYRVHLRVTKCWGCHQQNPGSEKLL